MVPSSPDPDYKDQCLPLKVKSGSLTWTAGLGVKVAVEQQVGFAGGTLGTQLHNHIVNALVHVDHVDEYVAACGRLNIHLEVVEITAHLGTDLLCLINKPRHRGHFIRITSRDFGPDPVVDIQLTLGPFRHEFPGRRDSSEMVTLSGSLLYSGMTMA